jgi:hypothetical protein
MKKIRVEYVSRTKLLDAAVASIQNRVNSFKSDPENFSKEDYETDHNLAGRSWVRLPDEGSDVVFFVGNYTVDQKVNAQGSADFHMHYDPIACKIKSIHILLDEA